MQMPANTTTGMLVFVGWMEPRTETAEGKNVPLLPLNKIEAIWKSTESFVFLIINNCAEALFC